MTTKTLLKKPEILAPGGTMEKVEMAVRYGADAVYIGGEAYGLRAKAGNFNFDEMARAVDFAHHHGTKVYVATNIIAHNEDLPGLRDYLRGIDKAGVDAIIFADPALLMAAKEVAPRLELHLSTQTSTSNYQSVRFWQKMGVTRFVLGREVSLEEVREFKKHVDAEIEVFIHGSMCIAYSGRCVLSNYMTERDANRGGCAQSCRWNYLLVEDQTEDTDSELVSIADSLFEQAGDPISDGGEMLPVFAGDEGTYLMNSKDLSMIEHIPDLIDAGVDSLKIEGRMKSIHYVATVVNAYRHVVDEYVKDPEHFRFDPHWVDEVLKASTRSMTTGFYYNRPTQEDQIYVPGQTVRAYDFVGLIESYDEQTGIATIQQRNNFKVGQEVHIFGPDTNFSMTIRDMWDADGNPIEAAPHAMMTVKLKVDQPVRPFDMMRKAK